MKRTRNVIMGFVGFALLIVAGLAASTLVTSNQYPTRRTAQVRFTLPDEFGEVRKILIRTGGTKQIIVMAGDNEYLEEKWSTLGGGLESLNPFDPKWRLEMNGTLKVRSRDEYVERPVVQLKQGVKITQDEVNSFVDLVEGSERLLDYELTTKFKRDDKQKNTQVELQLTQEILTHAPWFAHWVADRRVYASAAKALGNQERAIKKLIADNRDKKFPLLQK